MDWYTFWIAAHVIGTTIGAGSVTTTDIYILRALMSNNEFQISERILIPFRLLVVGGLTLLLISGLGLFFESPGDYMESEKFQAKMVIVLILLANGIVMLKLVTPKLLTTIQMTQGGLPKQQKEFSKLIRRTIPIIVVSTVSWYAALILGAVGAQPWSIVRIIGAYLGVVALGIVVGLIVSNKAFIKGQPEAKKPGAAQAD